MYIDIYIFGSCLKTKPNHSYCFILDLCMGTRASMFIKKLHVTEFRSIHFLTLSFGRFLQTQSREEGAIHTHRTLQTKVIEYIVLISSILKFLLNTVIVRTFQFPQPANVMAL